MFLFVSLKQSRHALCVSVQPTLHAHGDLLLLHALDVRRLALVHARVVGGRREDGDGVRGALVRHGLTL